MWIKQFRGIKIFHCSFSNIFPYFPFPPPFVLFPTFFKNTWKYFCGFRSSERVLLCIFVHRVFQDMTAMAFDRYLSMKTLFTKKGTKSLQLFLRKSLKTATNHVFRHTYLFKFNSFCHRFYLWWRISVTNMNAFVEVLTHCIHQASSVYNVSRPIWN